MDSDNIIDLDALKNNLNSDMTTSENMEEYYSVIEELIILTDNNSFDARFNVLYKRLQYLLRHFDGFEIQIEPTDLVNTIIFCTHNNDLSLFAKSTYSWKYFTIMRNRHNWYNVVELDYISEERLNGLTNVDTYIYIVDQYDGIYPNHFVNCFLNIDNKHYLIEYLIKKSIYDKYFLLLNQLFEIYDFDQLINQHHINNNPEIFTRHKLIHYLNDNYNKSNKYISSYTENEYEPSSIDEDNVVEKVFECFAKLSNTGDGFKINALYYLLNYFEYMEMNQIVKTWSSLKQNNLSVKYILNILQYCDSLIAIEFILSKITFDEIENWLKTGYGRHYYYDYCSKLFVDYMIKLHPSIYDNIYAIIIMDYTNNIKWYFPDITFKEIINILTRYHGKKLIN